MKRYLVKTFFFAHLFFMPLAALTPPKPITGQAMITSQFQAYSGDYKFTFSLPDGWGIGDMVTSAEGGTYQIFPLNRDYGLQVEINYYADASEIKNSVQEIRKSFKTVQDTKNGFEVELSKAWYACLTTEQHLIQIWYSLPKKRKDSATVWKSLNNCVSISKTDPKEDIRILPVVFPEKGPWFKHPDGHLEVLFEEKKFHPEITCTAVNESPFKHLAKFQLKKLGRGYSGYFYIKWDQKDPSQAAFESHLNEMAQEIKTIEPFQRLGTTSVDSANGYGFTGGHPYSLLTIASKEFLFGFAIKGSILTDDVLNDLVNCIKYRQN